MLACQFRPSDHIQNRVIAWGRWADVIIPDFGGVGRSSLSIRPIVRRPKLLFLTERLKLLEGSN